MALGIAKNGTRRGDNGKTLTANLSNLVRRAFQLLSGSLRLPSGPNPTSDSWQFTCPAVYRSNELSQFDLR
jgi:hypothetical protein